MCETLLFSKKLANHSGAIKFFICNYNLARTVALPVQHCPGISDLDRDSLTLKSEGLPSGRYTGHLSLTEPNTCRAIAQPRASFLLETREQAHENQ